MDNKTRAYLDECVLTNDWRGFIQGIKYINGYYNLRFALDTTKKIFGQCAEDNTYPNFDWNEYEEFCKK